MTVSVRSTLRRVAACLAFVVLPSALRAEPASSLPRTVDVTVAGEPADASALKDTIRELLGRLQVRLVRAGAEERVLARVSVDLRGADSAVVVVSSGRDGRVLLRREVARARGAAVQREEVAHLVQEAVESELYVVEPPSPPAEEPAVTPTNAAPAASPPATASPSATASPPSRSSAALDRVPEAPSRFVLDVATLGGVGPVASGSGPVPRVGGGVGLALASQRRPQLGVTAAYAFPFENGDALVTARTSLLSFRLLPGLEVARTEHFAFDAAVGGGVDVLSVTPRSDTLPISVVGASTSRVDPVVSAVLTARIDVVPSVVFLLGAGVDADLARRSYVVVHGGEQTEIVGPWRVRPTLLFGFAFTALGPPTFARERAQGGAP